MTSHLDYNNFAKATLKSHIQTRNLFIYLLFNNLFKVGNDKKDTVYKNINTWSDCDSIITQLWQLHHNCAKNIPQPHHTLAGVQIFIVQYKLIK